MWLGSWVLACTAPQDTAQEEDTAVELESYACELGVPDADRDFQPLTADTPLELVLGFQGFLFVELMVRTEAEPPEQCEALMSLAADGRDPTGVSQPVTGFTTAGGVSTSEPLLLFLPDADVGGWTGRYADIAVKIVDAERECLVMGAGYLVDDDPCLHTGSEPICYEDTGL